MTSGTDAEELFVPGRLCLFGEHSDWAGAWRTREPGLEPGLCMVMGTDQGLRAQVEPAGDVLEIESHLPDGSARGPHRIPLEPGSLAGAAAEGGFFAYAAGTAAEVAERHGPLGLRLRIEADLPVKKGLSSSAATCVLVARAFARAHGLGFGRREEIEIAYRGERRTGSECGRMDQVCAYGRVPTLVHFDGDAMEVEELAPGGTFHFLIVDLRAHKDTVRILRDLNACFPRTPGAVAAAVREALGPANRKLLEQARAALTGGDADGLGGLMSEAQARFDRDVAPACPGELRAPRLHAVLDHPAARELALGGKGVGSQGDGSAQLLARGAAERDALAAALERALGVACLPLTIASRQAAAAAR